MAEVSIWQGISGKNYNYWVYSIHATFNAQRGNYIFARKIGEGRYEALYIGQTGNLSERLDGHEKMACARKHGVTHLHVHATTNDEQGRKFEESDLIRYYLPPCNVQVLNRPGFIGDSKL